MSIEIETKRHRDIHHSYETGVKTDSQHASKPMNVSNTNNNSLQSYPRESLSHLRTTDSYSLPIEVKRHKQGSIRKGRQEQHSGSNKDTISKSKLKLNSNAKSSQTTQPSLTHKTEHTGATRHTETSHIKPVPSSIDSNIQSKVASLPITSSSILSTTSNKPAVTLTKKTTQKRNTVPPIKRIVSFEQWKKIKNALELDSLTTEAGEIIVEDVNANEDQAEEEEEEEKEKEKDDDEDDDAASVLGKTIKPGTSTTTLIKTNKTKGIAQKFTKVKTKQINKAISRFLQNLENSWSGSPYTLNWRIKKFIGAGNNGVAFEIVHISDTKLAPRALKVVLEREDSKECKKQRAFAGNGIGIRTWGCDGPFKYKDSYLRITIMTLLSKNLYEWIEEYGKHDKETLNRIWNSISTIMSELQSAHSTHGDLHAKNIGIYQGSPVKRSNLTLIDFGWSTQEFHYPIIDLLQFMRVSYTNETESKNPKAWIYLRECAKTELLKISANPTAFSGLVDELKVKRSQTGSSSSSSDSHSPFRDDILKKMKSMKPIKPKHIDTERKIDNRWKEHQDIYEDLLKVYQS